MKVIQKFGKSLWLTALGLMLPAIAMAQNATIPTVNLPLLGDGTVRGLIVYIINILLAVVGIIAIVFLIYGGFRYITSAGNDEVAEGAKKTIQNAIIGLIIVILSYTIVIVIVNAIGGRP